MLQTTQATKVADQSIEIEMDPAKTLAYAEELIAHGAGLVAFARTQIVARTANKVLVERADNAETSATGALREVIELRRYLSTGNFTGLTAQEKKA